MALKRTSEASLKTATVWVSLGLALAIGLSFYKQSLMEEFSKVSAASAENALPELHRSFEQNFYFFFDSQFVPGVVKTLATSPSLKKLEVLGLDGNVLYDSMGEKTPDPAVAEAIRASTPTQAILVRGFDVIVLLPSGQQRWVYLFTASEIRLRILLALLVGSLSILVVALSSQRLRGFKRKTTKLVEQEATTERRSRFIGLRSKFFFTIVLINLLTGAIVFVSLTELQTREETRRIQKESILFSQFSTAQVISDFSSYFYFYYADKFVPSIKTILSTNENLVGIRIISRRTGALLFDSETAPAAGSPTPIANVPQAELPAEVVSELKSRDTVTRLVSRGPETNKDRLLSVVNTYRNENREALFYLEYAFTFQSLHKSIALIRRQLILDLLPAMVLGLLIAVFFAQLLISPIRRLVGALRKVSRGEFDVVVENSRTDEMGELVTAFNMMASELKKKKELRKYLSDSTYRQVMEGKDEQTGGSRVVGTRVEATVLFSDIRNFVRHCETLEAEEVTGLLNEYFSLMVEVIYKHGGEVDKFIGDAILAVFYVNDTSKAEVIPGALQPLVSQNESATSTCLRAVYCALEMREKLREFNDRRVTLGKNLIEIGVGINHGEIISGPIGAKDRMDFTVIGDVVNLANRIEKLTKQGKHTKIVFSNHVESKVKGLLEYEILSTEIIRGKEEEITVYELIRIRELKTLIANVKSGEKELRLRSIELLGQSRNRESTPFLNTCLEDLDEQVRLKAVVALSRLSSNNDLEILDSLFLALAQEKAGKVVSALITAIGQCCTSERLLQLKSFLDSPDERIVANTIEAMGQLGTAKVTDLILPKLASRNNRVKANAAMVLFAAGHVAVIDTLKPMLMYADPLMRSSAAFAIGELSLLSQKDKWVENWKANPYGVKVLLGELQECVPMLVSLLRDAEPMVKRQSIIALGKIKDKSAVLPLIDTVDLEVDGSDLIKDVAQSLRSIGSHKLVREVISRLT